MRANTTRLSLLLVPLLLSLAACDEKPAAEATAAAAQVNGEAIAVRDIERELTRAGVKTPNQQAANSVLNVFVEQRLLAQQAIKDGMDKSPEVIQALEAAQRQVLAQAYVEKVAAGAAKPVDADISAYYDKHPELFAERRIYRLQEIMIPVTPETVEAVKAHLGTGAKLAELVDWLKSQNIPARGVQSVKSAEQLPLELVAKLHTLSDGQAITVENKSGIAVLAVTGSQSQPLTLEQAKPAIERFLIAENKRALAKAALDKLRTAAKIEFVAPYAAAAGAVKEEPVEPIAKALESLK